MTAPFGAWPKREQRATNEEALDEKFERCAEIVAHRRAPARTNASLLRSLVLPRDKEAVPVRSRLGADRLGQQRVLLRSGKPSLPLRGAEGRAMPVTTVRVGRLTTIKPGTAAEAGLPSGAVGGAMAGTPPR
eukprot:scaffold9285_cov121-Isochrysis_galbana.AAC.2